MRIIIAVGSLVMFGLSLISPAFALDPVAPRSERGTGHLMVESPMPQSDTCEISNMKGSQSCKIGTINKVPIGDYTIKVKLQENEWTSPITIKPTELTEVVVVGYGNLKVNTPNPTSDKIEVYSLDGKLVKAFSPSMTHTLPTGTYNVKIKVGKSEATMNNVTIITNTTRELDVSL
jgi:hypothetical protein